jgi:hypothetical protein
VVFFAPLRFVLRSLGVGLRLVSVVAWRHERQMRHDNRPHDPKSSCDLNDQVPSAKPLPMHDAPRTPKQKKQRRFRAVHFFFRPSLNKHNKGTTGMHMRHTS